jgi:hypothetical protein
MMTTANQRLELKAGTGGGMLDHPGKAGRREWGTATRLDLANAAQRQSPRGVHVLPRIANFPVFLDSLTMRD